MPTSKAQMRQVAAMHQLHQILAGLRLSGPCFGPCRPSQARRSQEEDVARRGSTSRSTDASHSQLPGQDGGDSADELTAPEDERDLEPTPLATEDAAYYDDADDDLVDLGVQLGKMRITERVGGFVRPKLSE